MIHLLCSKLSFSKLIETKGRRQKKSGTFGWCLRQSSLQWVLNSSRALVSFHVYSVPGLPWKRDLHFPKLKNNSATFPLITVKLSFSQPLPAHQSWSFLIILEVFFFNECINCIDYVRQQVGSYEQLLQNSLTLHDYWAKLHPYLL